MSSTAGRRVDTTNHARRGGWVAVTSFFADPLAARAVVANLLTNALKYSAEDAPVSARLARKGERVELDVIDRGIGIAPESVKMLFDRYYQNGGGKGARGRSRPRPLHRAPHRRGARRANRRSQRGRQGQHVQAALAVVCRIALNRPAETSDGSQIRLRRTARARAVVTLVRC